MQYFLVGLVLVLGGSVLYLFLKTRQQNAGDVNQRIDYMNQVLAENLQKVSQTTFQQLNEITKQVNARLKENTEQLNQRLAESSRVLERSHKSIGERLDNAAKVVGSVTNKLSQLEESNKKIFDVGKDISQLNEILRAPKLRGNLSELFLADLLSQIFPQENYVLQHSFKTGSKVDAVIRLRDNLLVPVDAKFPLENFKKMFDAKDEQNEDKLRKEFFYDVKKHVTDIAEKYILPDEGTSDFALMYIPAENIYYETIIKKTGTIDIISYALEKRVFPVSPSSFYIYLQSILMGLKGMQIEKEAKKIWMYLSRLNADFAKFKDQFDVLGKHLLHAQKSYDSSGRHLDRFDQKLSQSSGEIPEQLEVKTAVSSKQ